MDKRAYLEKAYGHNNVCVGHYAGHELTTETNVIILGDDIRDINNLKDTIVINNCADYTIYIGPKIGGKRNELYYFLKTCMGLKD